MGDDSGRSRLSEMASATPQNRDRYVDFLRGFSISVVILGHWLGAVVEWHGGQVTGQSALDLVEGLWIVTWLLQVMPLFFFVGGFSNWVTYRGLLRLDEGAWTFLKGRAERLLRPVGVFLLFWGIVGVSVIRFTNIIPDETTALLAVAILLGPLWFLLAYLVLVLLTPVMYSLHERFRYRALVVLFALPIVVDLVRFQGGVSQVGWANFVLVWLFVHQFGFFYADGTADRLPKKLFGAIALGGYLTMVILAQLQAYPASMVGCCGDEISNMAPPTLAIMSLGIGQVGLAMVLRPAATRWLAKPRPWKAVIVINSSIMTLYLWHLSALIVSVAILIQVGFPQPPLGSAAWWALRPVWFALVIAVLGGFVWLWGRFERPDLDPAERYWDLSNFYAL